MRGNSLRTYQQIQELIQVMQDQMEAERLELERTKYTIPEDLPASGMENPYQCYSKEELQAIFHCGRPTVQMWFDEGLISGIKTGKGTVVPKFELERFQKEMLGKDISNRLNAIETKKELEREHYAKGI